MAKLSSIQIQHTGTKETRTMLVTLVTEKTVVFNWPVSGDYTLILKTGAIKAVSVTARRRHPVFPWIAVDLDAIREAAKADYEGFHRREELTRRIEVHKTTMPKGQNHGRDDDGGESDSDFDESESA